MALFTKSIALLIVLLSAAGNEAFVPATRFAVPATHSTLRISRPMSPHLRAVANLDEEQQTSVEESEVERLRSEAAKLRAEAALLEAEKADEMAKAAEKAFHKFDSNKDGEVTLEELKAGLEKTFKLDVPDSRVQDLMETFDKNGDNALQLEEFVDVNKLWNRLDQLERQEKANNREAAKLAQKEEQAAQEAETRLAVIREAINENEPTNTEKILSILPYLLPLLDALPYGRVLLETNQDNPLVMGLIGLFALYRAVPFAGFISYGILSFVRGNLANNKLIRFNANQAIYLDIALFIPTLIASIVGFAAGGGSLQLPAGAAELGQGAVFVTLLFAIGYSSFSSLSGVTPDKIPFISDAVTDRTPTISMFDAEGKLTQPDEQKDEKDE